MCWWVNTFWNWYFAKYTLGNTILCIYPPVGRQNKERLILYIMSKKILKKGSKLGKERLGEGYVCFETAPPCRIWRTTATHTHYRLNPVKKQTQNLKRHKPFQKRTGPLRAAEKYKVYQRRRWGRDEPPQPHHRPLSKAQCVRTKKDPMRKREVCFLWIPHVFVVV